MLNTNGNLGLGTGTTAPTQKLHVVGNQLITGAIRRATANEGYLVGSYNYAGANGSQTNPIYTIGTSYEPALTTLGNMYGIGYAEATQASFIPTTLGIG